MALTKQTEISDFSVNPSDGSVTFVEQVEIFEDGVSLGRLRRGYRRLDPTINAPAYVAEEMTGTDPETGDPIMSPVLYAKGDVVQYNGKFWISNVDDNAITPADGVDWSEIPQKTTTQKLTESVRKAVSAVTRQAMENGELTPEETTDLLSLYPNWAAGIKADTDDVFNFNGTPYKCVQGHVIQADWTPDLTPALWTEVALPGEILEWVQPTGAQDAYNTGDQVLFEGSVYESTIDANTWSPTDYPAGWTLVS